MAFTVEIGDTFLIEIPNPANMHLFVVITDVEQSTGGVLLVNFDKVDEGNRRFFDRTVCLNVGEHPFITRPSFVNYGRADIYNIADIQRWAENGTAKRRERCSKSLLEKIQSGVMKSPRTRFYVQEFFERMTWPL